MEMEETGIEDTIAVMEMAVLVAVAAMGDGVVAGVDSEAEVEADSEVGGNHLLGIFTGVKDRKGMSEPVILFLRSVTKSYTQDLLLCYLHGG